jgi:hypothetical protein
LIREIIGIRDGRVVNGSLDSSVVSAWNSLGLVYWHPDVSWSRDGEWHRATGLSFFGLVLSVLRLEALNALQ